MRILLSLKFAFHAARGLIKEFKILRTFSIFQKVVKSTSVLMKVYILGKSFRSFVYKNIFSTQKSFIVAIEIEEAFESRPCIPLFFQ